MAGGFGAWGKTKGGNRVFMSGSALWNSGITKEQLKSGTLTAKEVKAANESAKNLRPKAKK